MSLSIELQQIQIPSWLGAETALDRRKIVQKEYYSKRWDSIEEKVIAAIKESGQMTQAQISIKIEMSHSTVCVAMKRLRDKDLIKQAATEKVRGARLTFWGIKGGSE